MGRELVRFFLGENIEEFVISIINLGARAFSISCKDTAKTLYSFRIFLTLSASQTNSTALIMQTSKALVLPVRGVPYTSMYWFTP